MIEPEFNSKDFKELFLAILSLKDLTECRNFFRDICTLSELTAMSERLQVAKQLAQNKSYREISGLTGTSTTTVTRVAHWFHHGLGGYKLALDRLKNKK